MDNRNPCAGAAAEDERGKRVGRAERDVGAGRSEGLRMSISKRVATLAAAWVVAAVAVAEGSTMRSAGGPASTSFEGSILAPAAHSNAPASFLETAAASAGIGEATAPTALEPNPADFDR